MSGYLFDTDIVRRWYARNAAVEARVQALSGPSLLYISPITLGEIEFGHTSPTATDLQKQAAFRKWMREAFQVPELEITGSTALEYAKFRRRLFDQFDRRGKYTEDREDKLGAKVGIDENDLWLVAQACERNLKFITHDGMDKISQIVGADVCIIRRPQ